MKSQSVDRLLKIYISRKLRYGVVPVPYLGSSPQIRFQGCVYLSSPSVSRLRRTNAENIFKIKKKVERLKGEKKKTAVKLKKKAI